MVTAPLSAEQEELVVIETKMRAMDPLTDRYWKLKSMRNALRATTEMEWRHARDFGTCAGRWAPLPWPSDTKGRWRVIREFVEAYHGVSVGDVVPAKYRSPTLSELAKQHKKLGASLRQWVALTDELKGLKARVFRDPALFRPVRGEFLSAMTQREDDYEWAIHRDALAEDDPPVIGFVKDWADTQKFIPEKVTPSFGPYGSYRRLTDFVRSYLNTYLRAIGHPFDRQLSGDSGVESKGSDDHGAAFAGVWATKLAPRIASARLLPKGWDTLLSSDEVRDVVVDVFSVNGYRIDDVADDEPLTTAWKLDADELHEKLGLMLGEAAKALGVSLEPGGTELRTRAAIIAFVQRAAVGRAKRRKPRKAQTRAADANTPCTGPTNPIFRFRPGAADATPPSIGSELARLVAAADTSYWNGTTGMSCLTWPAKQGVRHLYVSCSDAGRWHVRFQFEDGSSMVAYDASCDAHPPSALTIEGRRVSVAANQFVDGNIALPVMLRFMQNGQLDEMLDWRVRAPHEIPMPVVDGVATANVDGEWEMNVHREKDSFLGSNYTVSLQRDGERVSGRMVGGGNPMNVVGTISGNTVRWRATFGRVTTFPTDVSATIDGDRIAGTITEGSRGVVNFSGRRRSP